MAMIMFQFMGSIFLAIAITAIILLILYKKYSINNPFTVNELKIAIIGGFVMSALCFINSMTVNNQLAFYEKRLMDTSDKKIRYTMQCKLAGYEDLDECPMYYEITVKEKEYKHKLAELMKKKYAKQGIYYGID